LIVSSQTAKTTASASAIAYRGGAREVTQLLRERCCIRFVLRREHDGLAAADQMPRQRSTDVADSDDCGCHGDSSFLLDSATNEAYLPNIPTAVATTGLHKGSIVCPGTW
jgi:hypothetical protein